MTRMNKTRHKTLIVILICICVVSVIIGPAILFGSMIFSEVKLNKLDSKQMYIDHADDLQTLADFALHHSDLTNICKSSSFSQRQRISKLGRGVYCWWRQTPADIGNDETQAVQQAFRNSNVYEITNYYKNGIVVFDLYSSMANTKMLVYTQRGEQLDNKSVQLTEWLSPNWYMAETHPR